MANKRIYGNAKIPSPILDVPQRFSISQKNNWTNYWLCKDIYKFYKLGCYICMNEFQAFLGQRGTVVIKLEDRMP